MPNCFFFLLCYAKQHPNTSNHSRTDQKTYAYTYTYILIVLMYLYTCTSKSSFRTSCGVLAISLEQQLRQGVPIFQVVGVGEPGCRTIPQLRHQAALPFRFLNWPRSLNGRRKILKYIFITIGYILIYIYIYNLLMNHMIIYKCI